MRFVTTTGVDSVSTGGKSVDVRLRQREAGPSSVEWGRRTLLGSTSFEAESRRFTLGKGRSVLCRFLFQ